MRSLCSSLVVCVFSCVFSSDKEKLCKSKTVVASYPESSVCMYAFLSSTTGIEPFRPPFLLEQTVEEEEEEER